MHALLLLVKLLQHKVLYSGDNDDVLVQNGMERRNSLEQTEMRRKARCAKGT